MQNCRVYIRCTVPSGMSLKSHLAQPLIRLCKKIMPALLKSQAAYNKSHNDALPIMPVQTIYDKDSELGDSVLVYTLIALHLAAVAMHRL